MILKQKRDKEDNDRKFLASIQGIDLGKSEKNPVQERIEEVKRRAAERELGAEEVQRQEFAVLGFGYSAE